MKFRVASLALAAVTAVGAGIAPVAQAQDVLAFECFATINLAAGTGTTTCNGAVLGGTVAAGTSISANVNYDETACPLVGQATGTVDLGGAYYADLQYARVGAVAAVILTGGHTGAAVAAFTVATADVGPGL